MNRQQSGRLGGRKKAANHSKRLGGFIQRKEQVGAPTVTPPAANPNATTVTKEQIMSIKDTAKRQAAMKANPSLFGISVDF